MAGHWGKRKRVRIPYEKPPERPIAYFSAAGNWGFGA